MAQKCLGGERGAEKLLGPEVQVFCSLNLTSRCWTKSGLIGLRAMPHPTELNTGQWPASSRQLKRQITRCRGGNCLASKKSLKRMRLPLRVYPFKTKRVAEMAGSMGVRCASSSV